MGYEQGRDFLKSTWKGGATEGSDQQKGIPMPPHELAFDAEALIALPDPKKAELEKRDILEVFASRQSRRKFGAGSLSLGDLSFLLWATQGVRELQGDRIFRTVPSAGSRHPFETYFYADSVTGLAPGLYRYIATRNAILPVSYDEGKKDGLRKSLLGQWFNCAVAMFWVYIPYRCEWRYTGHSYKVSAIDAGHIGQNGYLAAEALGIGCCAIGAYNQQELDTLLGVDGENEFSCYAALFGRYE